MPGFIKLLFTAFAQSITSFLYILIIMMVFAHIKRSARLEESWLGLLRDTNRNRLMNAMLFGMIVGLIASALIVFIGIPIDLNTVLIVWPLSLVLTVFDERFLCLSYAGGILSLVSMIFGWPSLDVSSILALIGILHLMEGVLILLDGHKEATPVVMEHKRFKPIGAFVISKFWPVPLVMLTAPSSILSIGGSGVQMPNWWPVFGAPESEGLLLLPIAVILEYSDLAITANTRQRSIQTSILLFGYGALLIAIAGMSTRYYWLRAVGAILMPILHELILYLGRKGQLEGKPIFGAPWRGLRILDVMPDSMGSEMGLKPGDILLNLNGKGINSEEMFQEALLGAPPYIWLDISRNGKPVVAEYKNYNKEFDNVGILFVPRKASRLFLVENQRGLAFRLWRRIQRTIAERQKERDQKV
jgi:hypothetical protein